ncbi:cupin domain-containing protein [Pseudomonas sp. 148P]|uniref:Cupin domain-containing protein n=1 Tax=Pseudomonas ulcerans TaxID=3115852 RepID=A0ABU7HT72_9PSED|nr:MULTISPECIES: cupin domain-containing protein [unclassified Pseudomonas]MEE1924957.1 cupin domain-containing protein [Pseudomonas sp. 147P]MEE1934730.1 cupin domain-containing protein [Pseudomonas sp. 148P]
MSTLNEHLNANLDQPAFMHGSTLPWLASPLPGVERRPLYRLGGEQARATSLVRYAPGSRFSPHRHGLGEEFVVLEGVFEDEHGHYPAGSYVRNPPGSEHAPGSAEGCMIFVRLRQFHPLDEQQEVREIPAGGDALLFENAFERVWVRDFQPGAPVRIGNARGLEVLGLAGELEGAGFRLVPLDWMRLPAGQDLLGRAGAEGARVWVKDAALDLGIPGH